MKASHKATMDENETAPAHAISNLAGPLYS